MTATADCLEETAVVAFLEGALAAEARAAVEAHLAACSTCTELVTWAAADRGASADRLPGFEGRPFVGQLHPGARVGRYQVLGAVGRGGMGEVYAAYHPDLDRRIALKVVQGFDGTSGERRVRLLREARAIARLSHPNVVTVHDAGTFGDRVFIAMELIDGQTIDRWLRAEPRDWRQVLDVFIAAGRGLAAAHAAGVVHRDFKPQNVMIAKDGAVRVMDFGLARLAQEEAGEPRARGDDESTLSLGPVTRTGAFIGTPAYMSPEQFRREPIDARSDQFSFCVALHEALFGTRPATATTSDDGSPDENDAPAPPPRGGAPSWLRAIVRRGASFDREQRYGSMSALLAALERGRTRTRRRATAVAVVLALLVLAGGGWRLARASRFVCAMPQDRVAAAWSADASDARRQTIHRAFAASGRDTAEVSWQRTSAALDDYMKSWRTMYLQACEATNVRHEQSPEVLDLRMSCLNDNLDQVSALTDALTTANASVVSRAVGAAKELPPVERCADIALLKTAVPLPKDEKTLREVLRLRRALAEVQAMVDLGDLAAVQSRSDILLPAVRATEYKPLLAELLTLIGRAQLSLDEDASRCEATLKDAMITAQASGDQLTAAKAAIDLIFVLSYRLGRPQEAEFWARFADAVLDRVGGDHERLRAWVLEDRGVARARLGDFEGGRVLLEKSLALKERILGKQHPDVAISLSNLGEVLATSGHPAEALPLANRAIDIFQKYGDPDGFPLGAFYSNQGDALNGLGSHGDAEIAFRHALVILSKNVHGQNPETAFALYGLGEAKLGQGAASSAVPLLEESLRIRERPGSDPTLIAETQFALARALWSLGQDRTRALSLAASARKTLAENHRAQQEQTVSAWLTSHRHR